MAEENRSEAHVDDRRGWHFDKVINMPLLIVILAQTPTKLVYEALRAGASLKLLEGEST